MQPNADGLRLVKERAERGEHERCRWPRRMPVARGEVSSHARPSRMLALHLKRHTLPAFWPWLW